MLQRFLRSKAVVDSIDSIALTSNSGINGCLRELGLFFVVFVLGGVECLTLLFSSALLASLSLLLFFFEALRDSIIVDWVIVAQVDCVRDLAGVTCHAILAFTLEERF